MPNAFRAIRTTIASLWMWTLLIVLVVIVTPFNVLWRIFGAPFDPVNYYGGRLFRLLGVFIVTFTPRWRFDVRGAPPPDPRLPYVVIANHESFADMLLLCHLPWEMKWLSKASIMKVPMFGWLMWAVRDIPVHRGLASSARAAMAECRDRLSKRASVMMFPEGTRSKTSEMLPFKDGAFRLAIEAGVPILPLALFGTRNAIAKHDWRINTSHAVVEILAPEPTAGLTLADIPALKERLRLRIGEARDRLRDELAREPLRR